MESADAPAMAVVVGGLAGVGVIDHRPAQRDEYFNLALPTLGGRQLWTDLRVANGWRLQRHAWTGHVRLLDPDNVRRCWGRETACAAAMDRLAPPLDGPPLVVLVHGLGRSTASMNAMVAPLTAAGFTVESFQYASTRGSLDDHAAALATVLAGFGQGDAARQVSFVTHSLGSLVVRAALADRTAEWRKAAVPQRAVLLAPPNQGTALAQALWKVPPLRWLFGGGGAAALPDAARRLPVPDIPFAIIAAGTGRPKGINPWLDGDNDGLVRVSETRLDGAASWSHVEALHTFVVEKPQVIAQTVAFLAGVAG